MSCIIIPHSSPKIYQQGCYWYMKSKHKDCMRLEDFPRLNSRGKRWSINNPLFRKLLCKHYVAHYVVTFKRLDKRIYYAYGMDQGVKITDSFDMYRELYDRFYEIDRTLPEPPMTLEVEYAADFELRDHPSLQNIKDFRLKTIDVHHEIRSIARCDNDYYRQQWEHLWRPLRYINYQIRTLNRRIQCDDCDEDELTMREAAIQGDLELAVANVRAKKNRKKMDYCQYCSCKHCVRGLWHLTASHVTGFCR